MITWIEDVPCVQAPAAHRAPIVPSATIQRDPWLMRVHAARMRELSQRIQDDRQMWFALWFLATEAQRARRRGDACPWCEDDPGRIEAIRKGEVA